MAAVDFKKLEKEYYVPGKKPGIVTIPKMGFVMVSGEGNPNTSKSYKQAMELLYGISYTIKMSKMQNSTPEGYYDYVVPPLEGLWWSKKQLFNGEEKINKDEFIWIAMIRQPEFVTEEVVSNAKKILKKKKPELPIENISFQLWEEGLCAQVLHVGSYDEEPATVARLSEFINEQGYITDINEKRHHHEIYLGDPRRTAPERLRTVIRHPIKKGCP